MTTTKKYNSIEAISLLLKGNKICYVGHNHDTGYYFDVSYTTGYEEQKFNPRVVEHNCDGSIYEDNVNIFNT